MQHIVKESGHTTVVEEMEFVMNGAIQGNMSICIMVNETNFQRSATDLEFDWILPKLSINLTYYNKFK